jgi:acyl-CoA oxidase
VETSLVDLLSFGLIGAASEDTNDPTRSLRMEITELCLTLLPNVIGLSDAFGFTDWELDRYYLATSVYMLSLTQ